MASPNYQVEDHTLDDTAHDEEVRSKPDPFQKILAKLDDLEDGMQSIHSRVLDLEAQRDPAETPSQRDLETSPKVQRASSEVRNATPRVQISQREVAPPVAPSTESQQRSWADDTVEVSMDYEAEVEWEQEAEDDSPNAKGITLFKVAERTEKFLAGYFSNAVPNQTRRQWRDKYGAPSTSATACPNMDKVIKTRLSAVTKSQDKQLARQQALLLDAVGPITYLLEEATKGELNQKKAVEAAQTALKLLGNASAHVNRERRRNALQDMNPRLTDMADDDTIYKTAAPALFGDGFCKKAKERDEELKCLNQASSSRATPSQSRGSNFFRGGRPYKYRSQQQHPRGTGQYTRGRRRGGFQRNYPYSKPVRPLEESKKP